MVIPLLSSFHQKCFLRTNLLSSGVVLDELVILHVVASAHPVDLLVHLSPVKKSIKRGKCVQVCIVQTVSQVFVLRSTIKLLP